MALESAAAAEVAAEGGTVEASIELLQNFFGAEIGNYTVLEYTIAAFGIAAVIGLARWGFGKAFGSRSHASLGTA